MDERLARLEALKERREQASKLNLEQAKQEALRKKVDQRAEELAARKLQRAQEMAERVEAEERGEDLARKKWPAYTAEECESWDKRQKKKAKAQNNNSFTNFNDMSRRKYEKLAGSLSPAAFAGEAPAQDPAPGAIQEFADLAHQPSKTQLSAMAAEVRAQIKARHSRSKRRAWDDDADVTFINERNYKFNKSIAKAYDRYTEDVKQSLERGSAL